MSVSAVVLLIELWASANAEAMGSNPVKVPKFSSGTFNLQLLKLELPLRRSYFHLNINDFFTLYDFFLDQFLIY